MTEAASVAAQRLRPRRAAAGHGSARVLRRVPHPARHRFRGEPRRAGDAAGPQRRGAHHHAQGDPRAGRAAHRFGHGQRERDNRHADPPNRPPRHRLLPRGARHLLQPDAWRRTCSCRRWCPAAAWAWRKSTRCSPTWRSGGTAWARRLSGGEQQMLAMARILRTGADSASAGRDHRRAGAGHRAGPRPGDPAAEGEGLHHRPGGAELPFRRDAGRPPLRRSSTGGSWR